MALWLLEIIEQWSVSNLSSVGRHFVPAKSFGFALNDIANNDG
jgi:hypothetical protein